MIFNRFFLYNVNSGRTQETPPRQGCAAHGKKPGVPGSATSCQKPDRCAYVHLPQTAAGTKTCSLSSRGDKCAGGAGLRVLSPGALTSWSRVRDCPTGGAKALRPRAGDLGHRIHTPLSRALICANTYIYLSNGTGNHDMPECFT